MRIFTTVPDDYYKNVFFANFRINEKAEATMAFDTGDTGHNIPAAAARSLKLKPFVRNEIHTLPFREIHTNRARVQSISIGSLVFRDQVVDYMDTDQKTYPNHIGLDILTKNYLLIDYPAKVAYLKPIKTQPAESAKP